MIEFVPDACCARAIQLALQARACVTIELELGGYQETFEAGAGIALGAETALQSKFDCLVEAFTRAFEQAGCDLPPLPERPEPPDFSECESIVQDLVSQGSNPLAALGGLIEIEYDETFYPTLIRVNDGS